MTLSEAPSPLQQAITTVTRETAPKFRAWGISADDIHSELWVYVLTDNRQVETWLLTGEEFRAHRALHGAAREFCEREKAHKIGYEYDDIAWYAPGKLRDLIPIAVAQFDGIMGQQEDAAPGGKSNGREGGNLLAMVMDVRRALARLGPPVRGADGEVTDEYLERMSDWLGGETPNAPGYRRGRRSLSNAAAQSLTSRVEQGGAA